MKDLDLNLNLDNVSIDTLEKKYVELLEIQKAINSMVDKVESKLFLPF
jgi:hypothetical protein